MKKAIIIFITASSLFNCKKIEQRTSDEVLFSITNECRANIKFYNVIDGKQSLSDIFDCSYVSFIALHVEPGKYKVKAETASGRSAEKFFTKGKFSQELNIEF
ncbi:MAG TPA: hypothetical protein VNG53_04070 [Bacteroidia bacterium]|nr:hypothetical protein [Bacteroidia bacterium]